MFSVLQHHFGGIKFLVSMKIRTVKLCTVLIIATIQGVSTEYTVKMIILTSTGSSTIDCFIARVAVASVGASSVSAPTIGASTDISP